MAIRGGLFAVVAAVLWLPPVRAGAESESERQFKGRMLAKLETVGVQDIVFAMRQPGKDPHWYANFGYFADDERRLTYGKSGKLCRLNLRTGQVTLLLQDSEGAVRDPAVHYSGQKILFAYRKGKSANYHLYEIGIDGTQLRQLTDGPYDDIEPCYLPSGKIVFVSSRCKRWVQCWLTQVAVLHRCDADGSNIRAISGNVEHDNTPWVLPDGRLLYQRWEYVDRSQVDYHHLWTSNPDGTNPMVFFGNMHPGTLMIDAKPIPGTRQVIGIFSPGHGSREHDGVVTVVDPSGGPDRQGSARAIKGEGLYRDPWAFSSSEFMAAQGKQIVLLDGDATRCTVYGVSAEEEALGLQCHEPRPIVARPRERQVSDRIDEQVASGKLILADIYAGRNMESVRPGSIKKLLVLESLPKPINFTGGMDPLTYGGSFTLERVLGTVPVEPDGSACMELPALRALFFVALDENDLAVKRMHSFLTVQPGEVTGCVGCHEQRTRTILPDAGLLAMHRPASRIEPLENSPQVFDFPRDIQPILNRLCVDCHGYDRTDRGGPYAGKLVLAGDRGPMFSHSYFSMTVRRLFSDNRNRAIGNLLPRTVGSSASRILTMVDGSHYEVQASEHDKRILRLWIDVGAPYPGTYAALGTGSIGGYAQNQLVNTDFAWPTTRAGAAVIRRRCADCHTGDNALPLAISDERGISFWRFDVHDPRLTLSRHIVFNLTRPQKSLLLLAPLGVKAGGLGCCGDQTKQPEEGVFGDTADPDYQKLLAMVTAGKENLETIKRFDMPGFQPRFEYLREMRRYGVLAYDHSGNTDPYELDRRYWKSLWYRAKTPRSAAAGD